MSNYLSSRMVVEGLNPAIGDEADYETKELREYLAHKAVKDYLIMT